MGLFQEYLAIVMLQVTRLHGQCSTWCWCSFIKVYWYSLDAVLLFLLFLKLFKDNTATIFSEDGRFQYNISDVSVSFLEMKSCFPLLIGVIVIEVIVYSQISKVCLHSLHASIL